MEILSMLTDGLNEGDSFLITNHYALASYGWCLYSVGKLWYYRDVYDTNKDGLGLVEIGAFFKQNWISMLFNAMLLLVLVPYTPWVWERGMELSNKDWPMTDLAYILTGNIIILVQIIIDFVKRKTNKL